MRVVITRLTTISPRYLTRLSEKRLNPALLNADTAWNNPRKKSIAKRIFKGKANCEKQGSGHLKDQNGCEHCFGKLHHSLHGKHVQRFLHDQSIAQPIRLPSMSDMMVADVI